MSALRRLLPAAAALLAAAAAHPSHAQSLLSSRGLGYTLEPLDARARALGGLTTGMGGPHLSLVNPAEAVGLPAPGLVVTFQPDQYDATATGTGGAVATSGTTARFPLILAGFPIGGRVVATLGYGSFLDQNWQVEQTDSLDLPSGTVEVRDRFVSRGGVARFRAGAGYRVNNRLSVGAAADLFTGSVRDSVTREISGTFPAVSGVTFTYTGVGVTGGVRWVPLDALNLAAAVSGGGRLEADGDDDEEEGGADADQAEKTYANPLTLDAGASARISQTLVLAASGRWAGWGTLADDLEDPSSVRDAVSASLGVEYEGFALGPRTFPLRLGARYAQLPFRWGTEAQGFEFPDERAVTGGIGARLAGGAAQVDLSAERGWRGGDAAGLDESFWRFSFSLTLLGR